MELSSLTCSFGGGFATTSNNYDDCTERILFITLIAVSTKKIEWQIRATQAISENAGQDKKEANIK